MAEDKILIINTGGTIGMVNAEKDNPLSPLVPAKTWEEIANNQPILDQEILEVETGYYQFDPLLDSSDINYENWQQMTQVISDNYDKYTGFVILHGTDTMCYTASALSFMLENLGKPVIITGSQTPMVRPRSDAAQNLVTAIHMAASNTFKYPRVPEVCIFFRDNLIRGCRSRKLSSSGYAGFESPNYPLLAKAGEHIDFSPQFIRSKPDGEKDFFTSTFLDTHVMVLEIFPGFDPQILRNVFKEPSAEKDRIKALVLKTFGAGNAPGSREFLSAIEYVTGQGTIVVDVTQCPEGMVELGLYEASSGLLNRGVISGLDLTPEAAVCKLMYLLGKGWPKEEVKRMMMLDQRGEQSRNIYNIDFDEPAKSENVFQTSKMVPGDIEFKKFEGASIRFQDVKLLSQPSEKKNLEIKIFLNHPEADETTPADDPRCACTIEREIESGKSIDCFGDIAAASKTLIQPGQMVSLTIVTGPDMGIQWENMSISIFTSVL